MRRRANCVDHFVAKYAHAFAPPKILGRELSLENDHLTVRSGQFSDTNRITPKYVSRDLCWIIARTKNHDLGAWEVLQQTFKVAVRRDQNEVMRSREFQNSPIAKTRKPISKRTLRFREQVARNNDTSRGDRLSSKRSFILWTL